MALFTLEDPDSDPDPIPVVGSNGVIRRNLCGTRTGTGI